MNFITDKIAIGNYVDATNSKLLQKHAIKSVLGLDGVKRNKLHFIIDQEIFNFIDGYGNSIQLFTRAIDILHDFVRDSPPVLVYCHAGRSRSVSIVAGYLVQQQNITVEEALEVICEKRSINVAEGLKELLYSL